MVDYITTFYPAASGRGIKNIINGAVFEVSRVLGAGFLENVYENALLAELHERGMKAEIKRFVM